MQLSAKDAIFLGQLVGFNHRIIGFRQMQQWTRHQERIPKRRMLERKYTKVRRLRQENPGGNGTLISLTTTFFTLSYPYLHRHAANQARRIIEVADKSQISGRASRSYLVFVPSVYDATKPAKLVVDFHGMSSRGLIIS